MSATEKKTSQLLDRTIGQINENFYSITLNDLENENYKVKFSVLKNFFLDSAAQTENRIPYFDSNGYLKSDRNIYSNSSGYFGVGAEPLSTFFLLHLNDVNGGIRLQSSASDGVDKAARIKSGHRTNAQAPITTIYCANNSVNNTINFGGGSSLETAVTAHNWWVALNNTTLQGTKKMTLTNDGFLVGESGTGSPQVQFELNSESAETVIFRINGEVDQAKRFEIRQKNASDAAGNYNLLYFAALTANEGEIGLVNGSGVDIPCIRLLEDGGVIFPNVKAGATQAGAGAVAGEIWKTASHATLPDNVLMIGV